VRVRDLTWMQLEAQLQRDDRIVLPLGSTEQHAYLSLETDNVLAERVAVEAAEPLGLPVLPVLPYGVTPAFAAYPGSPSLSRETYVHVVQELLASLRAQGFERVALVNGHGGNSFAREHVVRDKATVWHDWWSAPRVRAAIDAIDPDASHASWMEGFPWTRVAGVVAPQKHKARVHELPSEAGALREAAGDGSYGGWYERPEAELLAVWAVGVEETRAAIESGWQ
jgi:creatinine amidohydrolase